MPQPDKPANDRTDWVSAADTYHRYKETGAMASWHRLLDRSLSPSRDLAALDPYLRAGRPN